MVFPITRPVPGPMGALILKRDEHRQAGMKTKMVRAGSGTGQGAYRPNKNQDYCAVHPPSIDTGTPVIVFAASEHRNTASAPICSVVEN